MKLSISPQRLAGIVPAIPRPGFILLPGRLSFGEALAYVKLGQR
jgi:hypothetical protein